VDRISADRDQLYKVRTDTLYVSLLRKSVQRKRREKSLSLAANGKICEPRLFLHQS